MTNIPSENYDDNTVEIEDIRAILSTKVGKYLANMYTCQNLDYETYSLVFAAGIGHRTQVLTDAIYIKAQSKGDRCATRSRPIGGIVQFGYSGVYQAE